MFTCKVFQGRGTTSQDGEACPTHDRQMLRLVPYLGTFLEYNGRPIVDHVPVLQYRLE
jgi:hypothetical protein